MAIYLVPDLFVFYESEIKPFPVPEGSWHYFNTKHGIFIY